MKKILLIIFILFMASGCKAEYNLTIDDIEKFTYEETGYLIANNKEEFLGLYDSIWPTTAYMDSDYNSESPDKIPGTEYYEVESYQEKDEYKMKYHYVFPSNRFAESNGVRTGFYDFSLTKNETENTTTLDSGKFNYEKFPGLEELKINITINNQVFVHNADSVNGNTYTWIINPNNFETARILLSYQNNQIVETNNNENKNFIITTLVFLLFMVAILIGYYFYKHKQRK